MANATMLMAHLPVVSSGSIPIRQESRPIRRWPLCRMAGLSSPGKTIPRKIATILLAMVFVASATVRTVRFVVMSSPSIPGRAAISPKWMSLGSTTVSSSLPGEMRRPMPTVRVRIPAVGVSLARCLPPAMLKAKTPYPCRGISSRSIRRPTVLRVTLTLPR